MAESELERLKRRMEDLADECDKRGLMAGKLIRRELRAHEDEEREAMIMGDRDDG